MRTISLPPHAPTLIESTRAIGYSLEAAIADLIDNSISAFASSVDIFFFPVGESYIAILDDGQGMNSNKIEIAMRYGSQNPNDERAATDLGRFGLGLKTASLSQCRTLTVVSKQQDKIEARRWDIDHVADAQDWSLIILDTKEELDAIPRIEELRKFNTGTLVVWQNLDRLKAGETNFERSMGRKMDDVRSHLSLVFHRYLNGEYGLKKLQLKINGLPVEPVDPFLVRRNTQIMADEMLHLGGVQVVVRPYILPHLSALSSDEIEILGGKEGLRKNQGFYVYRNKRLLVWGTWFRMMRQGELSKLARIQVDIPNELDDLWTLDIKKSTAVPPDIVRNNLDSIIQRLAERSKQTWTFRGKKETRDSIIHIWDRMQGTEGGVFYAVNRSHPLVAAAYVKSTPKAKQSIDAMLRTIETGIPLNQLYVDLTSEKQLENETAMTEQEVENIIKILLDQMPTVKERKELLTRLASTNPFVNYPQLVKKYSD